MPKNGDSRTQLINAIPNLPSHHAKFNESIQDYISRGAVIWAQHLNQIATDPHYHPSVRIKALKELMDRAAPIRHPIDVQARSPIDSWSDDQVREYIREQLVLEAGSGDGESGGSANKETADG